MRRASVAAVGLVMALSAGSLWLLSPAREGSHKAHVASAAEGVESKETMRAMKEDLEALRGEVARARAERGRAAEVAEAKAKATDERAAHTAEPRHPRRDTAEVAHSLDTHIAEEPVDAAWGHSAEASIHDALRAETFAGSSLVRAECRSTLCRVEVAHDDPAAADRFFEQVRFSPPFDRGAGVVTRVGEGASRRTVVYMAREGRALPPLGG